MCVCVCTCITNTIVLTITLLVKISEPIAAFKRELLMHKSTFSTFSSSSASYPNIDCRINCHFCWMVSLFILLLFNFRTDFTNNMNFFSFILLNIFCTLSFVIYVYHLFLIEKYFNNFGAFFFFFNLCVGMLSLYFIVV